MSAAVQETAGVAARLVQGGHWLLSEEQVLDAVEAAILRPMIPHVVTAVNRGPGRHWDSRGECQMGRDARFLPSSIVHPGRKRAALW